MTLIEHVEDRLEALILGQLGPDEAARVEEHLTACPACADRHADQLLSGDPGSAERPPVPAGDALRSRLFGALDHLERFASFAPRLAALTAISTNDARLALHTFAAPEQMQATAVRGLRITPLRSRDPSIRAMLAWFEPGAILPRHTHTGEECVLVFEGAFATDDGEIVRAGEEQRCVAGTSHSIELFLGGKRCLCVIVTYAGSAPR
jgi:anti-sigma factor ChrR (cupin superfamily)